MPSFDPTAMETRCDAHAIIQRGEFILENNVWGAGQVSTFSQCVHAAVAGGIQQPRFAWTWDYPQEAINDVKAYPEIIFGKKPWASGSTSTSLPRLISPMPSLKVEFDLQIEVTGRYNTAFEVWLTTSPTAGEFEIAYEVMFWVGRGGGATPAGDREATITLPDGRTCELWAGTVSTWKYRAFVFTQPMTSGVLELGYYLNYLVQNNWLPGNLYLASLELGNEVWYGRGTTQLNHYAVTVGSTLPAGSFTPPTPVVPPVLPPVVTPPIVSSPATPEPGSDPNRAVIQIEVPDGAKVYIDDHLMQSTASIRSFASPVLEAGEYLYRVKVVLEQPGRYVEERREVVVQPGMVVRLNLNYLAGNG